MDPRIEFYKAAFSQQGRMFVIPVFKGTPKYQYGARFGDVLRGMWRLFKAVTSKAAQTLLRAGSEAIKEGTTVKDVIKSTVQPTVGAVLEATVDKVASKLIEMRNKHDAAPPPNPPIVLPELIQAGSGRKRRRAALYKKATKRIKYSFNQHPII